MKSNVTRLTRRFVLIASIMASWHYTSAFAESHQEPTRAFVVETILKFDEGRISYLDAEIAFDRLINPTANAVSAGLTIDKMVAAARNIAGPKASAGVKLDAVRKVIYTAGPWNDNRPFAYDLSDPLGQKPGNRRLSTYLKTRLGNCVSMPALFLIIADRLSLNVHLVRTPVIKGTIPRPVSPG